MHKVNNEGIRRIFDWPETNHIQIRFINSLAKVYVNGLYIGNLNSVDLASFEIEVLKDYVKTAYECDIQKYV